jgi:hypothetical protein
MQLERAIEYSSTILPLIDGWLAPIDCAVIITSLCAQANAGVSGDIAEIGVWRGKSAILLSYFPSKNEAFYAVDVFDFYRSATGHQTGSMPYADPRIFRENLATYGMPHSVKEIVCDSRDSDKLIEKLGRQSIRFFHVDGGHSYQNLLADLNTVFSTIKERAIIAFDDFMQVDNPEVTEVIFDVFRTCPCEIVPFAITGKKLYLCNRSDRDMYWRYLLVCLRKGITRKRRVMGSSAFIVHPQRFKVPRDLDYLMLQRPDDLPPCQFEEWLAKKAARIPSFDLWLSEDTELNAPSDGW